MNRLGAIFLLSLLSPWFQAFAEEANHSPFLTLTITRTKGHVVIRNNMDRIIPIYRSNLMLVVSEGKYDLIPPFPKVFPKEMPLGLGPGKSVAWGILVEGNDLYPYSKDRGGIRLVQSGAEVNSDSSNVVPVDTGDGWSGQKVKAVYGHASFGKFESNEVTLGNAQQSGADQPATATDSKPGSDESAEAESERRPRSGVHGL